MKLKNETARRVLHSTCQQLLNGDDDNWDPAMRVPLIGIAKVFGVDEPLLLFTRALVDLRKKHRIFHRRRWFQGRPLHGTDVKDIAWFTPQGKEMTDDDWSVGYAKSLGVFLNGDAIATPDEAGERIHDEDFYVLFNAHHEPLEFTLPEERFGKSWVEMVDTNDPPRRRDRRAPREAIPAGATVEVAARSFAVFERDE